MTEEILELSPIHTFTSLSKLVDFQGQPLDTSERMESSFMDFLEHVRKRANESGIDMSHIQDTIVALVQSADEYQQVRQFVSELMNHNQQIDVSSSEEREANLDYEQKARQLEYELQLMREQMECVIREADQTSELLDWKDGREKQMIENQMNAAKYRVGLEQENKQLLSESSALKQEVNSADEKERAMIRQCFDQLGSANRKIEILDTESKIRENANSVLEGKVQELTEAVKQMQEHQNILWDENTKLKQHLYSTYESHSRVAGHVLHLQSVNEEYKAMLGDTQSQLHELKSKTDILNSPQIPLSSEIESALHSTPEERSPNDVIGTNQQLYPVYRPIIPLLSSQVSLSNRESSDSDSFVCITDPKQKFIRSERSRGKKTNIPKSKSVTFLDVSDTESADEDPYGTKTQHKQVTHIASHSPFSPQLQPKFPNRKQLSHHDNVTLVKNVDGSVHLEKWRNLANAKTELIESGPGIKLKSKQKKYGGSLQDISAFFNDSKSPQQIESIVPEKTNNNNTSPNKQEGIINNLTETISQWWKRKN